MILDHTGNYIGEQRAGGVARIYTHQGGDDGWVVSTSSQKAAPPTTPGGGKEHIGEQAREGHGSNPGPKKPAPDCAKGQASDNKTRGGPFGRLVGRGRSYF